MRPNSLYILIVRIMIIFITVVNKTTLLNIVIISIHLLRLSLLLCLGIDFSLGEGKVLNNMHFLISL